MNLETLQHRLNSFEQNYLLNAFLLHFLIKMGILFNPFRSPFHPSKDSLGLKAIKAEEKEGEKRTGGSNERHFSSCFFFSFLPSFFFWRRVSVPLSTRRFSFPSDVHMCMCALELSSPMLLENKKAPHNKGASSVH